MGTHISDMAVTASPVIENLDVVEHVRSGFLARSIDSPSDPFGLPTAEKRFHHGVVEAIAPSAHARDKSMILAEPHPVVTSVLGALIGMNEHRLPGATTPDGHEQGIQDQLPGQGGLH